MIHWFNGKGRFFPPNPCIGGKSHHHTNVNMNSELIPLGHHTTKVFYVDSQVITGVQSTDAAEINSAVIIQSSLRCPTACIQVDR